MTTPPDNNLAPGCFGSALTFKKDSNECSTCQFAVECEPKSIQRLEALRNRFGIVVKSKAVRASTKSTIKEKYQNTVEIVTDKELPKKVTELMYRLQRANINIKENLASRVNPFDTVNNYRWLKSACDMLLQRSEGFTKNDLCLYFQTELNWSRGTASAHTIQAFQLLNAYGAAEEKNGRLKIV